MDFRAMTAEPASGQTGPEGPAIDFPVTESTALLNGHRELRIRHGSDTYRLRLTASGKLILTK